MDQGAHEIFVCFLKNILYDKIQLPIVALGFKPIA